MTTTDSHLDNSFISMKGLDWAKGPTGGIYLMAGDTSRSQVQGARGKRLTGRKKLRGWDGGRFIPGNVKTTEQAVKACGLDWIVDRRPVLNVEPIWGVDENGPAIVGWEPQKSETPPQGRDGQRANDLPHGGWSIVPDRVMNVRRDNGTVLGVTSPGWQGPQNHEAFAFVDDLVDNGAAKWLGGGESNGGGKIWMVAQLDRQVVLGGDENELSVPLCYLTNGWDCSTPLAVTVAPYRMACLNGQTIPLEGHVRTWSFRHTSNPADRLQVARKSLELSVGYFDEWAVEMEKLMTKKISVKTVESNIKILLPDPKPRPDADGKLVVPKVALANVEERRSTILDIYRTTDNLQHLGNTAYRFFNAVTEYADWHTKGKADAQVTRTGEPNKLKDAAYRLVTA